MEKKYSYREYTRRGAINLAFQIFRGSLTLDEIKDRKLRAETEKYLMTLKKKKAGTLYSSGVPKEAIDSYHKKSFRGYLKQWEEI